MMKKNVVKSIAMLLVAILSIGVCASCGKKGAEDGKVSISVGAWPSQKGDELDRMNAYKDDFEAQNPDIVIEPDTWTFDLRTFYPKAEAGLLPTLFETHFTEFEKLTNGDYVADITDAMKEMGYYDNLNPRLREMVTVDGKIYAMPRSVYALGLHYNTKLFEQAGFMEEDGTPKQPKDWYELAEMAKKIKEVTGVPGFAIETSNNCGGWLFTNIAWSFGVDFMKQNKDGSWTATFDTPEAVEAVQFLKDLKWKYDCVPASNNIDLEEGRKLYCTGGAAMVLDGPDGPANSISKYDMDINDFGLMAIPAGPKGHYALMGGTLKAVSKNASKEERLAAMKWLKFTGVDYVLSDNLKEKRRTSYKKTADDGNIVGIKLMAIFGNDTENIKNRDEIIDEFCNINPNHVRLYNESVKDESIILRAEEPICAQDLYSILDNVIQEVFSNKDADCAAIVKQANSDFQKNYLDKIDY